MILCVCIIAADNTDSESVSKNPKQVFIKCWSNDFDDLMMFN